MRTWLTCIGALAALTMASSALAADHRDAPGTTADPSADINDVYAFTDAGNIVIAMTVFPVADNASWFSDSVQYVFNVDTGSTFGETVESNKLICTFDAAKTASCYFGTPGQPSKDWVEGDATGETGITSESGMLHVFTGLRADPFFFNLEGFNDAVGAVVAAAPTLTFDPAGCPAVDAATSGVLVGMLQGTMGGTMPAADFFATLNTLAIVVSMDRSLLNAEHNLLAVWASTHQGQ
jgi:hypothetical protein